MDKCTELGTFPEGVWGVFRGPQGVYGTIINFLGAYGHRHFIVLGPIRAEGPLLNNV